MLKLVFEVNLYRMMKTKGNHEVSNTEVKVVVFALAVSQKTDLKANPVNVSRIVFTLSTTRKTCLC